MENLMAQPTQPPAADPDNVPETLCCGRFNLSFLAGSLATLTFTHPRPKAGPLLDTSQIHEESVVRARIVMHLDNLLALRNFLNEAIKDDPATMTTPVSGGSGKPN
jgi:hypothetical protein